MVCGNASMRAVIKEDLTISQPNKIKVNMNCKNFSYNHKVCEQQLLLKALNKLL